MLQQLEQRRLLSVNVTFDPQTAVLDIVGSQQTDHIQVLIVAGTNWLPHSPALPGVPQPHMYTTRHGVFVSVWTELGVAHSGFYAGQSLQNVNLLGSGGDDVLKLSNSFTSVNTSICGDEGNDLIQAFTYGVTAGSQVFAGEGNDLVQVFAESDDDQGHIVMGEDGHDTIFGSALNDKLYGDADESRERFILIGDDEVYGGEGDDQLYGGAGDDLLSGEDGDDVIVAGLGCDLLNGGTGVDFAYGDCDDKFVDIEKLFVLD